MTVAMAFCMLFALGTVNVSADGIAAPTETNYTFTMNDKVGVKLLYKDLAVDGVNNAIRFTSAIEKSAIDENVGSYDVKVKTIIAKTESLAALEGEDFTKANLDEKEIKYQEVVFSKGVNLTSVADDVNGTYVFNACLYNLKDENFTKGLSAVSYLEIDGVATQHTETASTNGLWEESKARVNSLETEHGSKQNVLESGDADEYEFVSTLCKTYDVAISNGTEVVHTQTVKHGEKLSKYINAEFNKAVAKYENFSYATAFNDAQDNESSNAIITKDTTLTAVYGDEGKVLVDGTTVTGVGSKFFDYTTEVVIPDTLGVTAIGGSAFLRNSKVTRIVLPESVTAVGGSAFFECTKLETAIMPGVTTFGDINVFYNCTNLETVVLSSTANVTRKVFYFANVDNYSPAVTLFVYGDSLENFTIVNDNNNMLNGTKYLYSETEVCGTTWKFDENKNVVIRKHTYVDGACSNCGAAQTEGITYTYVDYSSTVEGFKGYVVSGYTGSATEVYVRATYNDGTNNEAQVIAIAPGAFANNSKVTKVVLPMSVKYIGSGAFSQTSALETIIMPGVIGFYNVTNNVPKISNPTGAAGADKDDIGLNVFLRNNKLTVAVVNENLQLDRATFVADAQGYVAKLDLYVYGDSADGIVQRSDNKNNMLTGVRYLYSETETCGTTWKYGQNNDVVINVKDHTFAHGACSNCGAAQTEGITYELIDGNYVVTGYTGSATEVYVRSKINGVDVVKVASGAFSEKNKVTKIVLPESVTVLGESAFAKCSALETLIMPGVLKVVNANGDYNATSNNFASNVCLSCDNLKVIVINSNLAMSRKMFNSDNGVTKVASLYVYGASFTGSDGGTNGLLTGTKYYYSETEAEGCWYYDDGVPTLYNVNN